MNRRYEYKGFSISDDGGPDARWIALRIEDGVKLRADTLAGAKQMVTDHRTKESAR